MENKFACLIFVGSFSWTEGEGEKKKQHTQKNLHVKEWLSAGSCGKE